MISDKDVKYIAGLSRIHLRDEEAQDLARDLEGILDYVKKLETLDVSGIEPTSHVLPLKNVYREDEIKPSLNKDALLKNSVKHHNGSFQVPKVIE